MIIYTTADVISVDFGGGQPRHLPPNIFDKSTPVHRLLSANFAMSVDLGNLQVHVMMECDTCETDKICVGLNYILYRELDYLSKRPNFISPESFIGILAD